MKKLTLSSDWVNPGEKRWYQSHHQSHSQSQFQSFRIEDRNKASGLLYGGVHSKKFVKIATAHFVENHVSKLREDVLFRDAQETGQVQQKGMLEGGREEGRGR